MDSIPQKTENTKRYLPHDIKTMYFNKWTKTSIEKLSILFEDLKVISDIIETKHWNLKTINIKDYMINLSV